MYQHIQKHHAGFTIIEMIIVAALISILSMVVLFSINEARKGARDTIRRGDLQQIQLALKLYFEKCGTYRVRETCGSGAYYGSTGSGWFNHDGYGSSAGSVAEGLVAHGLLPSEITDPRGITTHSSGQGSGYMIYANDTAYTLWTNLEDPSDADIETMESCALSNYDNYHTTNYPEEEQMNYCVSS